MAEDRNSPWWWPPVTLWELLAALVVYAGYWVRPYDMLADRRRWFWQPRRRCLGVFVAPAARYDQPTSTTEG